MFCYEVIIERLEKLKKEIDLSVDCAISFIRGINNVGSAYIDIKSSIDSGEVVYIPIHEIKEQEKNKK